MRSLKIFVFAIIMVMCAGLSSAIGQVINSFSPASLSAGTGSQVTIKGSGFGPGPASATKYVEFANADNGGITGVKPALIQYTSWSDTEISVIVPDGAGTGAINVFNGSTLIVSSTNLTVSYGIINITTYPVKHVNNNTLGGYTWQLEKSFNAQSNAKNSFLKSLKAWTCATGMNWKAGDPTPANQTGRDGINIVRFDSGAELPAGVLGVANTYYTSCGSNKWEIAEIDLVFDKERNWNFEDDLPAPSQSDFQSVVQHELGHALSLSHVNDQSDLMNYSISPGTRRTIGQNNQNAGNFQVTFSVVAAGGSCSAPITALALASCGFTYPKITSINPTKAGKDTKVKITGSFLNTTNAVSFGGIPAASFVIISDTEVEAVLGEGASGEVAVTTSGGVAVYSEFTFLPPPVINSFSPEFGFTGDTITIVGVNLTTTNKLSFGGTAASFFKVVDDQTVKGVPAGGASGKITITTEAGSVDALGFIFVPKPSISSFSPSVSKRGDTILINGADFRKIKSVSFGGVPATYFKVDSTYRIYAVVGSGASGQILISSDYGNATKEGFVYIPPPTISSFNPLLAAEGANVTILGSNFSGATEVLFGGKPVASYSIKSPTEIVAVIGANPSGSVSVKTLGGTAVKEGFTFIPTLRIETFSPKIAAEDQKVVIKGTNFVKVTEVTFGGTPAKSFIVDAENTITATLALGSTGEIKVRTSDGVATIAGFTFIIKPKVDFFTPASAGAGTTVRITGTNFTEVTSVQFGGTIATSFRVLSPTTIEAVVADGASGLITVSNLGGSGELSGFTFIPLPVIASVDPLSAGKGAEITIRGSRFLTTTAVSIGNKQATSFKVVSAEHIIAYVAEGASDGNVVVSTVGGVSTFGGFRFILPPVVSSFSPDNAIAGVSVLITGVHLADVTNVSFGGKPASSFTILSPTSISAVVAAGSTSGSVSLTSAGGVSNLAGFTFVYTLPSNTISISSTDLTCRGSMNGIIKITTKQNLNYVAIISGNGLNSRYEFSSSLEIKNLSSGIYNVCITINGESTFKQCSEINIREPKDLSLYSMVDKENTLRLQLAGADTFFVKLNDELLKTSKNELSLSLKSGLNSLSVYSDKLCQGIIERTFMIGDGVKIFPIPFDNDLNIILGREYSGTVRIEVRNIEGKVLYSRDHLPESGTVVVNLPGLSSGTYLLQISSKEHRSVHKILRR